MFNRINSNPTVTNCTFSGNSADFGGGMFNLGSSPTVANCTFTGNTCSENGGGMYNSSSSPMVTNCTFSGNTCSEYGGGMYNSSSSPTVTNCILWGDTPDEIYNSSSTPIVSYCDVEGGWSGEGNIDENPLLRNVAEGELSLVPWSPCIDSGNNAVVGPNATDITGLPRLVDGDCNAIVTVDMGAHEFRHAYGGDFDSSCLVNMADFAFLAWAWLANPLSENWDPVCDIGIPADGSIDNRDLRVLTGNWLLSVDTPITCESNRLKDEFGLDAVCTAAILTAAPCAYLPSDVAQALYDAGYSAAGAYRALTQVCGMSDGFALEQLLYNLGYPPEEYLEFTALSFVRKFAPVLYFDQAHEGLPMSAQVYFETVLNPIANSPYAGKITWTTPWNGPCGKPGVECLSGRDECTCGMQNNDFSTLRNGQIPTYYKVISDIDSDIDTGPKGRLRIAYWWFYGFQKHCNIWKAGKDGAHHGDWEFIWVTTDPDRSRADAVTYVFHGVWYTRKWGGFQTVGDNPVVYVGKLGHGNYHNDDHSGWMYGTPSHCCQYADYRDETEESKWYNTYDNLVSLRGSEPWMLADRIGSLYEYYGVEYIISAWRWGPHISFCHLWNIGDLCIDWHHTSACSTHPTVDYPMDWDIDSCKAEGCRDYDCEGLVYTPPLPDYNQGWPWGGGAASSAAERASPVTGGAVASCGRCGASRFSALVRLGNYWLATP
jgi:parallel beta-helix repeat protein